MKALLLKDWYMTVKYCKAYLLIIAVFVGISAASDINFFYGFYACLMAGMVPVTLLGYDERSKWTVYSLTLPYTRAQLVSAKYIIGGCAQLATLVLLAVAQDVRSALGGGFDLRNLADFMSVLLFVSCMVSSLNLPFVFKFGVEKGRIWYYVMLVLSFGVSGALGGIFTIANINHIRAFGGLAPLFIAAGIAAYVLSWRLSVRFYEKREF